MVLIALVLAELLHDHRRICHSCSLFRWSLAVSVLGLHAQNAEVEVDPRAILDEEQLVQQRRPLRARPDRVLEDELPAGLCWSETRQHCEGNVGHRTLHPSVRLVHLHLVDVEVLACREPRARRGHYQQPRRLLLHELEHRLLNVPERTVPGLPSSSTVVKYRANPSL